MITAWSISKLRPDPSTPAKFAAIVPVTTTRAISTRRGEGLALRQADEFLDLSTTLVAPTSTSARPASFRPAVALGERDTRVLVEQTTVVDPQRLGRSVGRLDASEVRAVDEALALVLGI